MNSAYRNGNIKSVLFIRSEYNLADVLMKKVKTLALLDTLKLGKVCHSIEQWIDRKPFAKNVDEKKSGLLENSRRAEYSTKWKCIYQHATSVLMFDVLCNIYNADCTVRFHCFYN